MQSHFDRASEFRTVESACAKESDQASEIVRQDMQAHLCCDEFHTLVRKCVAPIQALIVPIGCSTVRRRVRIASGVVVPI